MFHVLVLLCSTAVTPALGDCTSDNAIAAMAVPETVESAVVCMLHGEAYIAQTELGRSLAADEVVKIVCRRDREAAAVGVQRQAALAE